MMSTKSLVLCFGILALTLQNVNCFHDEDIGKFKELFEPIFVECGPKFGITKEQLQAAKEKKEFSSIDNCFLACVFKHIGFINDKGMFDKDSAISEIKKHLTGDDASGAAQIAENCISVNDDSVSDGDAGCERAKLLMECIRKNKDLIKH